MWTFPRCSAASAEDRSDHDGPVGRAGRCVGSAGSRGQLFRCAPSDAMPRRGTPTVFAGIAASAFVAASPRVVASAHILASPIPAHTGLSAHRQTPLIQSAGWTMRRSSVYRARRAGGPVTKMRLRRLRAAFRHCSRSLFRGGGFAGGRPPRASTVRTRNPWGQQPTRAWPGPGKPARRARVVARARGLGINGNTLALRT